MATFKFEGQRIAYTRVRRRPGGGDASGRPRAHGAQLARGQRGR